ncbi:glycosyltransferase family 2 protein [Nonomuraea sp. B1E8]|uniref:glycosyltransferase n=1 Tax=unclassified Nonomuraea TaxID=2593643 RepID=UPI00325C713B
MSTAPGLDTTLDLDYVLPLRWDDDQGLGELTGYLSRLSRHARVIVVDGSRDDLFARHAARWRGLVRHARPAAGLRFTNGKVAGVTTGLLLATGDRVVIADDDVRYDLPALIKVHDLLARADLVRPQNYFDPLPWHARWDTARTLLNRAFGADYPGTFGVRRGFFVRMGGYDGDVLFENLELIRTVRAHGGHELHAPGLYVRRLPCDARRFWSQRVRQAYDDLAQPARMAAFLPMVPALAALAVRRPRGLPALTGLTVPAVLPALPALPALPVLPVLSVLSVLSVLPVLPVLAALAVLSMGLAEAGRRRAGGRQVFPASAALPAPVWVLERAVCSWLALGAALTGGVPYAGGRIRRSAHSVRALRRRVRLARGTEAAGLVRAVAERLDRGQAATAQSDGRPAGVDGLAVLGEQLEVAPDEQGTVGARGHGDRVSHARHLPQG